jgi:integration host factor subunit beta
VFESIIEALKRGEKIELRGFGSFRLRKREPRKGRNPKTATRWTCRQSASPISTRQELKDLINKDTGEPIDGTPTPSEDPSPGLKRWTAFGRRGDTRT